jgi:hypothetical protein
MLAVGKLLKVSRVVGEMEATSQNQPFFWLEHYFHEVKQSELDSSGFVCYFIFLAKNFG